MHNPHVWLGAQSVGFVFWLLDSAHVFLYIPADFCSAG